VSHLSREKGNLSIHSENIFPIIKKWLYSDHDIFVRELISNACDAITKLKRLNSLGEIRLEEDDFKVEVKLNVSEKTIQIIDNGIGMTDEEIKKYINQIAFSGAEDFLNMYKDKEEKDQIIGHFGLGFYSSYMVADTVDINTLSYQEGAKAVSWSCDGGTEFEMDDSDQSKRGTAITLHIGEDGEDFLKEEVLKSTIEKYCSFMPYPIMFECVDKEPEKDEEGNVIIEECVALNDVTPLYTKAPRDCTDEEYKAFYKNTFKDFKEPLFWIHLNMDYPFNLKGILYFPKLNNEFESIEGQIKLYNNQVFVADNIKEVIPEFLLLLKGVIDCPDLPLNVSRSLLQNDGFVTKISSYISKKVADKLNGLYKTERLDFEKGWDDISPFIKFGSLKDEKFAEKVAPIILYKTTEDKYVSLDEYKACYEGKFENTVYYVSDAKQQAQYIKMLQEHGIESVILDHNIDQPFISLIESKNEGLKFKRVDSDLSDVMKDEHDDETKELVEKEQELLLEFFKKSLSNDAIKVQLETLKNADVAGMIVLSEESRRMQDMMKMYGMAGMDPSMFPSEEVLVLNRNHPLVKHAIANPDEANENSVLIAQQIYDLAILGHRQLTGDQMKAFIDRSNKIMSLLI